jgi:outer membrane protein insertion porin family
LFQLTKIKTAPIQIVELKYQHIDPRGKQRAKKTIHQQTDSEANEKETRERGKKSNLNDEEKSSLESTSESAEPSSTSPAYIPHSSPAFLEKCFGSLRNAHSLKEVHDTAKFIFDRMRAFDTHEFGYLYLEPYPPLDDVTTMKNPIQQTPPTKSISDRYSLGPLSPLPCIAHVVLREKKRTGLNVGVTHSTTHNETVLETQLMLRNVFGNGEKLTGDITYSLTKSSAFQLHFSKPLLHWGWDKWADFEIFQQTTNNMLHSSHVEKKRGIALRYSFGRHSLSYDWSWRRIQLGTHATEGLLKEGGHNVKSSLIHRYFIDTRDDSLLPTEGFAFRFMQELAGIGGDVKFLKHEVDTQLNWPITTPGGAV